MRIDETYFKDIDTFDDSSQPEIDIQSSKLYRFYIGICLTMAENTWMTFTQGLYNKLKYFLESLQFITEVSPEPIFLNDSVRLEFREPFKDLTEFSTEEYNPDSHTRPCVAIGFDSSDIILRNPKRMYQFYKIVFTTLFGTALINDNFATIIFSDTEQRKSNLAGTVGSSTTNDVRQKITDMSIFSAYRIVRFISDEQTQQQYTDFVKFTYEAMGINDGTKQIFSRTYGIHGNLNTWSVADSYIQIPFTPVISSQTMLKKLANFVCTSYCRWPYLSQSQMKMYDEKSWIAENYIKPIGNISQAGPSKLYIASNPRGTEVNFIIQRDGMFEEPSRPNGMMNELVVRLEISITTNEPETKEALIKQTARFLKKDCKIKPAAFESFVVSIRNSDSFRSSEIINAIINEMRTKK